MIALLTKDLLTMKKIGIRVGIILLLYAVIFSSFGSIVFLSGFIIIFSTMLIVNAFAFDELSKWDTYALSLPVTKKQIVLSRYLLGFLFDTAGYIISILLGVITRRLDSELSATVYCFFAASLFIMSLMMPFLYKFGTQKARIWIIVLFLMPTAGIAILKNFGVNVSLILNSINNSTAEFLVAIFLPISLLLYVGSYFFSCRIYQNKEI